MATALSPIDYVLWVLSSLLQVVFFLLLVRARLYRRVPFFSFYILIVLLSDATVWWTYHVHGYTSSISFSLSWVLLALTLAARGMAVGELCHRVLNPFRGVWALAWRLLSGVTLLLVVYAGLAAYSSRHDYVLTFIQTAEGGLELAAAVLLLLLLAIGHYYRIRLPAPERLLIVSLCAWSLVQVLNDVAWQVWADDYFEWAKKIRMMSYQAAVLVWIYAVRRPVTAELPPPAMNAALYNRVAPEVNFRLQVLNDRLLEIFKA